MEISHLQLEWVDQMKADRQLSLVPSLAQRPVRKTANGISVVVPIDTPLLSDEEDEESGWNDALLYKATYMEAFVRNL